MTKKELKAVLEADSKHFKVQTSWRRFKYNIFSNPISDNKYIWKYIKTMRMCEYCLNSGGVV